MSGVHPLRSRRRTIASSALLATLSLCACSDRSPVDRLLPRADLISATTPAAPAAAPSPAVITLITGDRVQLSQPPLGEPILSVEPGPGRAEVVFAARVTRSERSEDVIVMPSDAIPLVASGRLDPQLFNVSELLRQGFGDAEAPSLPVIVTYAGRPVASLAASGARPVRWLASIQGEAVLEDRRQAGAFWRWVTGGAPAGGAAPARFTEGVARVWLDARLTPLLDESAPLIGAPEAWDAGLTGAGVTVAVLDTGVKADHPDLSGRIVEAVDFTGTRPDGSDNVGHGTHVAGIIAGSGAASAGTYRGIAPDASLIVGKVCTDRSCSSSAIIAGMEWAAPRARIVNLSLGSNVASDGTDPLSVAVDALTAQHGTLFVAAAGNAGAAQSVSAPAAAASSLAVASLDKPGGLSAFSSRGPRVGDYAVKPDIAAPGRGIVAARAAGTPTGDADPVGDSYLRLSGTSMACPHVAASAALLAQQHPEWKADQIKTALMSTSRPVAGARVYESGVGRVDLARAVRQQVRATSGSLSFGLVPWPHEAPPVTRSITYQNDGSTDLTLDLELSATGQDGLPAPAGLFTADRQVTVPAGGTARVDVTMTPQPRSKGLYGLQLTATDGIEAVQTAASVYQEPEAYDLTVETIDQGGGPARSVFGFALDTATGQSHSISHAGGPVRLRLERGEYDVDTLLYGAAGSIAAARPMIALDQDTTVTLDARLARPLGVALDRPEAALLWSAVTLHSKARNGRGASLVTLSATPIHALPTGPVTGHLFALDFRATLGPPPPTPPAVARAEDYVYNLVFPLEGGVPEELTFRVKDEELGIVHAHYHTQGDATALRTNLGRTPDGAAAYVANVEQPLPGRRLEYYTAGASWQHTLQVFPPGERPFFGERTLGNRIYQPGVHHLVRWYSAPVGPSFGPDEPGWGAYRVDNQLTAFLTPFSPGETEHATIYTRGTTTLARDGVVIGTSAQAAYGRFTVPADAGTYTLEATGTREVGWSALGTSFSGSWIFRSEAPPDGKRHALPLLIVHATAPVDERGGAPAGLPFLLGLEVQRPPGAPEAPLTELRLEASYDDGQSWQEAEIVHLDGRPVALLFHPAAPGFVSLRASAADAAGSSVVHTVGRAYRTR